MKNTISIAIVCENASERSLLVQSLKDPSRTILTMQSKEELLKLIAANKIDLLVIDLVLRDFETIMLLREIHEKELLLPFTILLSNRAEEYIHLVAYESGVDDIFEKPIKSTLFMARINAILRRRYKHTVSTGIQASGLYIDREKYSVFKHNEQLYLPKKEFELLHLFYSNPGKIFSRREIITQIWKNVDNLKSESRSIDAHVRHLRMKVGSEVIKSVKGIGYGLAFCELTAGLFRNNPQFPNSGQ